jgi:hypothetical protein
MEMGGDTIGRVDVTFLAGPGPTAVFSPPSPELAEEKRQFGASRRQRWFGHAPEIQAYSQPGTSVGRCPTGDRAGPL